MTSRRLIAAIAASLALTTAVPAAANTAKVGALRCAVSAGLGLIITSAREMRCTFTPTRGRPDHYYGTIRKFGLDIGATAGGVLAWEVFAETAGPHHGALAGDYDGVAASATVGVGIGANALVGGSNRSFTLQPLSAEAQTGVSLAAGVASLHLRAMR
ncbi:MAG: DUF992 domain-containing protein [Ancalomicrobiaceae bacterium]|nr:DUF992 domain-containing protein [Ancalomicrobiaceae bacterium]